MHYRITSTAMLRIVGVAALTLGFWTHATAQETHTHGPDAGVHGLTLNAGQRWTTDQHLRKAMGKIRHGINASLEDIQQGRLAASKYDALAQAVNAEVSYMVSNCKLEPQADAQLHRLIADLLEGADAMAGKGRQLNRQQGALKVIGALENYGAYFDDPDWKPLTH